MTDAAAAPTLDFSREEFASRVAHARAAVHAQNLDAVLLFAQESLYYLTGYDTSGFLTATEQPIVLLTRRPDLEQARRISTITDVRVWYDAEGADPSADLQDILQAHGLRGARVGIEVTTFGLTGFSHARVARRLAEWCELIGVPSSDQRDAASRRWLPSQAKEGADLRVGHARCARARGIGSAASLSPAYRWSPPPRHAQHTPASCGPDCGRALGLVPAVIDFAANL
jgi:hypothetical protein